MQLITTRRAFDPFLTARRLDAALNDVFGTWMQESNGAAPAWVPAVDVLEHEHGLELVAELPGVDPTSVKVTVEQNVLTITGEKPAIAHANGTRTHRVERSFGKFTRRFTLPSTVDSARVEATAAHGVLTITLPKAEQAKAREIAVRVA